MNIPSRKLWQSGLFSIILLLVVYLTNNYASPFLGISPYVTLIESFIQSRGVNSIDTSRVFINTGYEVALAETRHGKEKITDRAVLLQLLNDLEQKTDYKAIFVDIRFEKGLSSKDDSALVERLLTMPNTFSAKHWDYANKQDFPLIDDRLLDKACYADFSSSIFNSSFRRYEFIQHGSASAALKLYNDINHSTIKQHGRGLFSFYTENCRLCNNAAFVRIPEDMSPDVLRYRDDKDHTFRYYNLGEDIYGTMSLDPSMLDRFFADCKDKIIVIGDFVFDQHDTYYNKQPGPYLNYLAYSVLRDGRHIIGLLLILCVLFVYFFTFFHILSRRNPVMCIASVLVFIIITPLVYVVSWIRSKLNHSQLISFNNRYHQLIDSKFIAFITSFFGYTILLSIASLILFAAKGKVLTIFIPSIFFTIIDCLFRTKLYANK